MKAVRHISAYNAYKYFATSIFSKVYFLTKCTKYKPPTFNAEQVPVVLSSSTKREWLSDWQTHSATQRRAPKAIRYTKPFCEWSRQVFNSLSFRDSKPFYEWSRQVFNSQFFSRCILAEYLSDSGSRQTRSGLVVELVKLPLLLFSKLSALSSISQTVVSSDKKNCNRERKQWMYRIALKCAQV